MPGYTMRNYGAMKMDKLVRCIAELERGSGDAYDRCMSKGGDPAEDLRVARGIAEANRIDLTGIERL